MLCRLCSSEVRSLDKKLVLNQFQVEYFQCPTCDLIQTEPPYWLDKAYTTAISSLDVGAMSRNLRAARVVSFLSRFLGGGYFKRCLDYGGGAGALVRLLRDRGLNFYWLDAHSANVYAQGFEGSLEDSFDAITCIEVWEHFDDVKGQLENLFKHRPKVVLVETLLHWGYQKDWWYFTPESGQHISFFSQKTLSWVAQLYGYQVVPGLEFSVFAHPSVALSPAKAWLLRRLLGRVRLMGAVDCFLGWVLPRQSLSNQDALLATNRSKVIPS